MTGPRAFLSRRLLPFETSVFGEVRRLALANEAIDLSAGEPDFDGPEFIKEAAVRAIRSGCNQYSPASGLPDLTRAITEHQRRFYGLDYDPEREVTVFAGASEALFSTFQALCDPGDEVILLQPFFDVYYPAVMMAGGVPRVANLGQPGFWVDIQEIERVLSPRTKAIVVNDPHNPTGRVFSSEERRCVAELCERHDLWVISDQVYEHIDFVGSFVPLATLGRMRERTVAISSLSKTFGLTGWKIGYACAPRKVSNALRTAHKFITLCASTPLQLAMAEALRVDDCFYEDLRSSYRARSELLCEGLRALGLGVFVPAGGAFVLADVRTLGYTSGLDFCLRLPGLAGVAARPLGPFHLPTEEDCGFVRFAFCRKSETLRAALNRLQSVDLRADA